MSTEQQHPTNGSQMKPGRPAGDPAEREGLEEIGKGQFVQYAFYRLDPAWRRLPAAERRAHQYPSVKLNTTYSFGLDDQEFVVAFETDEPRDFVDLVQALRETEASLYTERDTPIFSCRALPLAQALDCLDGDFQAAPVELP